MNNPPERVKYWLYLYPRYNYIDFLPQILRKWVFKTKRSKTDYFIFTENKYLINVLYFLKYHSFLQYKLLLDITAIDYPISEYRFKLIYTVLSIQENSYLKVCLNLNEMSKINSSVLIYQSANWFEREIWDLFGIFFVGHPELRRILTDYGFNGYPLRKDFPVSGFFEFRYDISKKRIFCELLEFSQEPRIFNFENPWALSAKKSELKTLKGLII